MTGSNDCSARVAEAFNGRAREVSKRLKALVQGQEEQTIHQLRTSIRRYESVEALLPGRIRRSRNHKKFREGCEDVFKSTTPIRDIDVVMAQLAGERGEYLAKFKGQLAMDRKRRVKVARRFAKTLLRKIRPSVRRPAVPERKCEERVARVKASYYELIASEQRQTLSDEGDVSSLHHLRKLYKDLRYTLEAAGSRPDDAAAEDLETFQEILGRVHDEDILIAFLRKRRRHPEAKKLLEAKTARRHEDYLSVRAVLGPKDGMKGTSTSVSQSGPVAA